MTDTCREAFEKWSKCHDMALRTARSHSGYAATDTNLAWESWQAAWNTRAQGNLINDPLYKALDDLYERGWEDNERLKFNPRGTKEWQAALDAIGVNHD